MCELVMMCGRSYQYKIWLGVLNRNTIFGVTVSVTMQYPIISWFLECLIVDKVQGVGFIFRNPCPNEPTIRD